ncbi:MAG: hypothetical protein INQ03_23055 [Candidatus Heimdallarchaeota archaeon]|nr:hypothetical protein [Candidatus Heimdallarchaeota archaeon]
MSKDEFSPERPKKFDDMTRWEWQQAELLDQCSNELKKIYSELRIQISGHINNIIQYIDQNQMSHLLTGECIKDSFSDWFSLSLFRSYFENYNIKRTDLLNKINDLENKLKIKNEYPEVAGKEYLSQIFRLAKPFLTKEEKIALLHRNRELIFSQLINIDFDVYEGLLSQVDPNENELDTFCELLANFEKKVYEILLHCFKQYFDDLTLIDCITDPSLVEI